MSRRAMIAQVRELLSSLDDAETLAVLGATAAESFHNLRYALSETQADRIFIRWCRQIEKDIKCDKRSVSAKQ